MTLHARELRCEFRKAPLGIDETHPRLSWKLDGDGAAPPVAYRVVVAAAYPAGEERRVWDSGRIEAPGAHSISYDGAPLQSLTRYRWRLTLWDGGSAESIAESWFETGVLHADEWRASWIGRDPISIDRWKAPTATPADLFTRRIKPNPYLRRSFELGGPVVQARVLVTARGLYRLSINGARVGDDELTPGWTDYRTRIYYQSYDVTEQLRVGENVIGALLGDGWYSGFFGQNRRRAGEHYGTEPSLWLQLEIDHEDGSRTTITSDDEWRESAGPMRYSDLLLGEWFDARLDLGAWDHPGFDSSSWRPVCILGTDSSSICGAVDEPIRVVKTLPPRSVTARGNGRFIVDFGQNLAGRVRIKVPFAQPGMQIQLRHAEILVDGELFTENLRAARATDTYVTAGGSLEVYEPSFTTHGFRYVEVDGYPGELSGSDIVAVALESDLPTTGTIVTSDDLVNRLQANIEWSQRGNFASVPTDCPQRDERLGWLADAQVFLPTAAYNADVAAFFTKWMRDVRDAQSPDGVFPNVAPKIANEMTGAPAWGDGGVLMPWHLYRTYGDLRMLAASLPGMVAWVEWIRRHNPHLLWDNARGPDYGDWLEVDAETPHDVLATAFFARDADLVARAARLLGEIEIAERHEALFAGIRTAFNSAYVSADGRIAGETQTAYLLPLAFELLDAETAVSAARHLAADVADRGVRLTTGFVGVAYLCPILSRYGYTELAVQLLQQKAFPSWLYPVANGATTVWERWDSWVPDAGMQPSHMNSLNHYSLGSVGEWMYSGLAGIAQAPESADWQRAIIAPQLGGSIDLVRATFDSPRGMISVEWTRSGADFQLDVSIPPGMTALVRVPVALSGELLVPVTDSDAEWHEIGGGAHHFESTLSVKEPVPEPEPR